MDYGQKIAELRKNSKLTQAELGTKLNITAQAVSKWENNLSEPDIDSIRKMCEIFEVSVDEFLGLSTAKKEEQSTQPAPAEEPQPVKAILGYCEKCKKTRNGKDFYGSNNLEKYPEGKMNLCKDCQTMHVDNWNPDTYLWILQEADVPYIPEEWNKLMASWAKDRSRVTGTTILGRYLSKMKLNQW